MGMTSKQIDELRAYAKDRKGELAKMINDAADTIEMLSAKLHASQMERSSQYYHGGWIPVSERLPEDGTEVFIYLFDRPSPYIAWIEDTHWYTEDFEVDREDEPIAWMPLPEPYRGEGEQDEID